MSSNFSTMPAAQAPTDARAVFIRRTYGHLAGAILALIGVDALLLQLPVAETLIRTLTGGYAWLAVVVAFMFVSSLANRWARSTTSRETQYAGLGLFIVAQAVILLPILYITRYYSAPSVIPTACLLTGALFLGLTVIAFTSGSDFSMLRGAVTIGGFLALGLIVASILFGINLGLWFAVAMVALAAGSILVQTSGIIRDYGTDQYVAAALGLFGSVAFLFFNILRLVSRR